VGRLLGQQEALVGTDPPDQRPLQRRQLVPQPALRDLRDCRSIGFAADQRGQHLPTGEPHDVGGDIARREVGPLQGLL